MQDISQKAAIVVDLRRPISNFMDRMKQHWVTPSQQDILVMLETISHSVDCELEIERANAYANMLEYEFDFSTESQVADSKDFSFEAAFEGHLIEFGEAVREVLVGHGLIDYNQPVPFEFVAVELNGYSVVFVNLNMGS